MAVKVLLIRGDRSKVDGRSHQDLFAGGLKEGCYKTAIVKYHSTTWEGFKSRNSMCKLGSILAVEGLLLRLPAWWWFLYTYKWTVKVLNHIINQYYHEYSGLTRILEWGGYRDLNKLFDQDLICTHEKASVKVRDKSPNATRVLLKEPGCAEAVPRNGQVH